MELQEHLDLLDWLENKGVSDGDAAFILNKYVTTEHEFSEIWLGYLCDQEHKVMSKITTVKMSDKATSDKCIAEDLMKKYNALDEAMKAVQKVYS